MTATIAGIYKQGKVELLEIPQGLRDGRVVVTLEQATMKRTPCFLVRGKYKMAQMSSLDDFKDAERNGEEEFDN